MAVERRLTEIVGAVGGKLHTARSRNDQVATDMAMFTRAHALRAIEALADLQTVIVQVAEAHLDWPMPGYTHLQRAQPVYLSHHLLAYFWMFRRDAARFAAVLGSTCELPLGAGALAGVNFATDRRLVASELGFAGVVPNSIDAVSNRDFVLDFLSAASTCATHLSRLGAEIVLWSSEEFGFCEVSDAWASSSSIMPQKKNPDAAELLRAKAPRVVGHLAALHGVMHGLPLTYNKDMQEDKEHLFDAVDTLELCLAAARGMLGGMTLQARAPGGGRHRRDARRRRRRRHAGQARRAVPPVARDRGRPGARGGSIGARRCRSSRPRNCVVIPTCSMTSSMRCYPKGHGSSPRRARAGRRWIACASNWPTHGRRWTRRPRAVVLRPAGARGGAGVAGLRGLARVDGGRDRRDRGLPLLRAGLPRLRRRDPAHGRAARAAGHGLRVPVVRDPRAAQRGLRARRRGGGGADPRAGAACGARSDARRAAAPASSATGRGS